VIEPPILPIPPIDSPLLAAWQRTLALKGSAPAILSARGAVLRSFDEIETESCQLARFFGGLPPHAVVGMQIGNSERWPAVLLALWRQRLIPLPLGCHMQPAELELALSTCHASALLTLEAGQPSVRLVRKLNGAAHGVAHAVAHGAAGPEGDFLKLTSGTTSLPRAIRFRASQLLADAENICATMGITPEDVNFGVIPISHSYGFSNLITPLLAFGVPLAVSEDRIPRAILEGLARTEATVFPATPVLFQKLGDMDKAPKLPKLRLCISAGAPLLRAGAEPFTAKFGLKIHTFYGASECGGIAYDAGEAMTYEDGCVGTPMRGVEITHSSTGSAESGAITVRSAAVGEGYFPECDEASLGHGRFVPGDLIRKTAQGLLVTGRVSEIINVAGRKLNPLEVEARLAEFPGVKQAVVFGVRSELRGEEPVACVAGQTIEREALMRHCHTCLSTWQIPRDLWIVDEIPSGERGKISRRALAESYGARIGSKKP
jgi:long-chain acyl-CoA synthetase